MQRLLPAAPFRALRALFERLWLNMYDWNRGGFRKLMKVCDLMSDKVVSIDQDEPVSAAARLLKQCNVGALPVCDGKKRLRGMLTDRDIVTRCVAAGADPGRMKAGEIMSRGVVTAGPFDEIGAAAQLMRGDQVRRLPVLSEGRLVGVLSLGDLARDAACEMEAASALSDISSNFHRR